MSVNDVGLLVRLDDYSRGATATNSYPLGSSANPTITKTSATSLATGQVSVGATATLIVAARTTRSAVTVENFGTTAVYLGPTGVTTATGFLLPGTAGASVTFDGGAAIYGVVATGTQTVAFAETF